MKYRLCRGYCVRRGCDVQGVAGGTMLGEGVIYRLLLGGIVLGEDVMYRVLQGLPR